MGISVVYSHQVLAAAAVFLASVVAERNPKLNWKDLSIDTDILTFRRKISVGDIEDVCRMTMALFPWNKTTWLMRDGPDHVMVKLTDVRQ